MSVELTSKNGDLYKDNSKVLTELDIPKFERAKGSVFVSRLRGSTGSYASTWLFDSNNKMWGRSSNNQSVSSFCFPTSTTATDWFQPYFPLETGTIIQNGGISHGPIVLFDTGNLYAWGYANRIYANGTAHVAFPQITLTDVKEFYAVKDPGYHNEDIHLYAKKFDSSIWAIGYNGSGQLNNSTTTSRNVWGQVFDATEGSSIKNIRLSSGYGGQTWVEYHDGTLKACGYGGWGNLGNNSNVSNNTSLIDVTTAWYNTSTHKINNIWFSGGGYTTAAYTEHCTFVELENLSTGTLSLMGAGSNAWGQLADNTTTDRWIPVTVIPELEDVTEIIMAPGYVASGHAIKSDGTLIGWGYNGYGQLGDGTTTSRLILTTISIPFTPAKLIYRGCNSHSYNWYRTTFIKDTDNNLWSCGYGDHGQCGVGNSDATNLTWKQVQLPKGVNIIEINGYGFGSGISILALSDTGDVYAWGYNGRNEINRHTTNEVWTPVLSNVGGYS